MGFPWASAPSAPARPGSTGPERAAAEEAAPPRLLSMGPDVTALRRLLPGVRVMGPLAILARGAMGPEVSLLWGPDRSGPDVRKGPDARRGPDLRGPERRGPERSLPMLMAGGVPRTCMLWECSCEGVRLSRLGCALRGPDIFRLLRPRGPDRRPLRPRGPDRRPLRAGPSSAPRGVPTSGPETRLLARPDWGTDSPGVLGLERPWGSYRGPEYPRPPPHPSCPEKLPMGGRPLRRTPP